jgi:hypothetical protein
MTELRLILHFDPTLTEKEYIDILSDILAQVEEDSEGFGRGLKWWTHEVDNLQEDGE